jgi:PAS domain S-box-containing protein
MNKEQTFKYRRFVYIFVAVLLLFLAYTISVIISQRHQMLDEIRSDSQRELQLIGTFALEALLKMDYAAVEQFLHKWANEHEEILELTAIAPNGFVLAHQKREVPGSSGMELTYKVMYDNRALLDLKMVKNMDPAQESMIQLTVPLILGTVAMTIIVGLVLWIAMQRLALIPMEREITIRRQAESRFRMLLESAPDAMILADQNGIIRMVNSQAEILFGYKRKELEGSDVEILMPERYREKHRLFRQDFSRRGESRPMGLDIELVGLSKEGREFPVDISLSPIETEEGLLVLSAIRDVTDRKLAEAKIRRSYHFQTAVSGILRLSLESTSLDDQLRRVLEIILSIEDLSAGSMGCIYLTEAAGRKLNMAVHMGLPDSTDRLCSTASFGCCPCGRAASEQQIIFASSNDKRHEQECSLLRDDEHAHYCVPVISGKKTLGVINILVDSGHIRSDDEESLLKSIADAVAVLIEHNRADSERQQLQEQLAMNEKLSALGRFTANVAHEIRTPLTLIGGFARRLLKNGYPGETKESEYLDIIISEVDRLEKILRNVLNYSRSAAPLLKECHINEVIKEAISMYDERIRSKSIRVEEDIHQTPAVMADRDQILEVVGNLFSNAIDSMPDGGILSVGTGEVKKRGAHYIVIHVSDTGEGMTEDQIKMIFEPFYSTKVIGRGTGLGLSIAKKIMEDHRGFIEVESSRGSGSTFRLYFPLDRDQDKL